MASVTWGWLSVGRVKFKYIRSVRNKRNRNGVMGQGRTEGDRREQVVRDVIMRDVVEEEAAGPAEERPVDGADSATEEAPLLVAEVRNGGVGVVQVGEHDDPVVREDVRHEVELGKVGEADLARPENEGGGHDAQTDVGRDDAVALVGLEERRRRLEVLHGRLV